ncbi:hypothetical protein FSP39_008828 [Pinctada imbricata]|uniref:T-lymphoma invasion and metastasis-inducing protein 2 n=1 Tax=Pinctada imbricata TaxID=66713 RepID=A0AA88Y896_PINIB|nr:hypothetical protein FSP39_008828 [Pinctada imbricata]
MRKMAELQLTVVTDPRSRHAIIKQINQWEENLEKLYVEQYRMRCYIASLQGSELPNPKVLLSSVSRASKSTLSRLGTFTVTSFHALVAARKPLVVPNIYGKGNHTGGMLSPRGDGTFKYSLKPKSNNSPVKSPSSEAIYKATDIDEVVADLYMDSPDDISGNSDGSSIVETLSRIALPNNQTILVGVDKRTTVQDLLESVCSKRQLNPCDHYVRIKLPNTPPGNYTIPDSQENIKRLRYESIEVCQKSVFQLQLVKSSADSEFGFAVEAELAEDYDREDDLRLYVSNVTAGSVAQRNGLAIGDEILIINGQIVSELDLVYIEEVLHSSKGLCLTVRSLRTFIPSQCVKTDTPNIDTMVCPPPPSQSRIPEKVLDGLTVPAPQDNPEVAKDQKTKQTGDQQGGDSPTPRTNQPPSQIDSLLQGADQVTSICRQRNDSDENGQAIPPSKPLSEAQKLRKVIMELIDTERAYVKDLNFLTERYLEPLKEETFLTSDEIDQLFGNIQEIVMFQRQFLQSLEEALHLEGDFFTTEDSKAFRRILFSLGGSFLFYANHFKVYSSFCASHTRSQKILNPVANEALKAFLGARNPKQQHSYTLDSYLIKPIQRILKYPLLLQQLCHLTDVDTDEHYHLSEALKGMEAVAEHINEMQKIFEEYGAIFDELSKMFRDLYPHKRPVDLSVGELQMYGTVEWCNMCDSLGKVKKGLDLENIVFVFKSGVVFICREKVKKKIKPKDKNSKSQIEVYESQEKFRTVIPVSEVQVQNGKVSDMDRHYWWDLVHCRSDKEARPERLYSFCNSSAEAKSDFMKIIRQTIRESVRKMTLPNGTQPTKKNYVPYGGKRISNLGSNPRTLSKKRGGRPSEEDGKERHSMDFEEKVTLLVDTEPSMRTRSRTVGDLNDANLEIPENDPVSNKTCSTPHLSPERKSSCSSSSNLSTSSRNSASARLTQASNNPLTYSSTSVNVTEGPCSPVWKPRNESNMVRVEGNHLAPPATAGGVSLNPSPNANLDCSDIVFRRNSKTIVLQQPHNSVKLKDTEC